MPIHVEVPGKGIVEFPDGTDQATMERALQSLVGPPAPTPTPSLTDRFLADNPALPGPVRALQGVLRLAKAHPVTAGALAGGAAVAPFTGGLSIPAAMAVSGAGSGIGGGLAGLLDGQSLTAAAKAGGEEALLGAAGEGVGQVGGRVLAKAAKGVYRGILRPSLPLQREFGRDAILDTAMAARLPVSDAGAEQAAAQMAASARDARGRVSAAQAAGAGAIPAEDVAETMRPVLGQAAARVQLGLPDEAPALQARIHAFVAQHPNGLTLEQAQALKEDAQDLASRAYRAEDRGGTLTDLGTAATQAQAKGLRQAIEARVPEVGPANARTQDLIGVTRALEDAGRRNLPAIGVLRELTGSAAPGLVSSAAIRARELAQSPWWPDAVRSALLAALGADTGQ